MIVEVEIRGWTTALPIVTGLRSGAIERRGRAILARLGVAAPVAALVPECRTGAELLLASVQARDPRRAAHAAERLIGLGPGLTPAGDDMLAAAAAVIWSFASAAGWSDRQRHEWLRAAAPPDLRGRTTATSAALLELAVRGEALAPMRPLLDLGAGADWAGALVALSSIGASTGGSYAVVTGAAAQLCAITTKEMLCA